MPVEISNISIDILKMVQSGLFTLYISHKKKRVILYLHRGEDQEIGQVETRTSQDIGGLNVRNTFAKSSLKAGEPIIWLSVFNPYDDGQNASKVASMINTSINENGSISAKIGNTGVLINQTGEWSVKRN